ncbi:MAG TPA: hypothetical protein VK666_17525 [Chryseolinea sp.]|nr:hypothetical protein [Chryseolinea sp.]
MKKTSTHFANGKESLAFHPKNEIMITPIRFQHKAKTIQALLVCNFDAISDTIVIVPKNPNGKLEEDILFFKTGENKWVFDDTFSVPSWFSNLRSILTSYFKSYQFTFEDTPRNSPY